MLAVNLNRLPERIGHPTNLEVAEYSQRVMTDEVQKVDVGEMNRPILPSHCHAVRIDRAILLLIADVTEYRQNTNDGDSSDDDRRDRNRRGRNDNRRDRQRRRQEPPSDPDDGDGGDEPSNDSASDENELDPAVRSRKRLFIKLQKFDGTGSWESW